MTDSQHRDLADIKAIVAAITEFDSPSNYRCCDDAQESILSEVESDYELSPDDAYVVNRIVEQWLHAG